MGFRNRNRAILPKWSLEVGHSTSAVVVVVLVTSVCAGAVEDVKSLKTLLSVAVHNSGDEGQQVVLFRRLQSKLLLIRDLGNRKLQVSSQLLETVSTLIPSTHPYTRCLCRWTIMNNSCSRNRKLSIAPQQ